MIAGKEYGSGSSRDWAAKGTLLLGVKAVIAESFERIHRSNLVGMGVLPLTFTGDDTRETLGLTGFEEFDIRDLDIGNSNEASVIATDDNGEETSSRCACAWIRPRRSSTTSTAASCTTCCASSPVPTRPMLKAKLPDRSTSAV